MSSELNRDDTPNQFWFKSMRDTDWMATKALVIACAFKNLYEYLVFKCFVSLIIIMCLGSSFQYVVCCAVQIHSAKWTYNRIEFFLLPVEMANNGKAQNSLNLVYTHI